MDEPPSELTQHPNDGFFKDVFSDPALAATFFKSHLSDAITGRIDWSTLTVLPGSFVKANLRQLHSDLLFSVRLDDKSALLYLLFEHQSTVDPAIPLRLLGSVSEILRTHQKKHGFPLPSVIPFVLHQGPDEWMVPISFQEQFALSADLKEHLLPFVPKFEHALLDLSRYDPASAEDNLQLRAVLQLMKLARKKQILEYFRWLAKTVTQQLPDTLLSRLLLYALHTDSNLDPEQIIHSLSENPELKNRTMSVAEKLIAKGVTKGIAKGKAQWVPRAAQFGRIQNFQELLGMPQSSFAELEDLPEGEVEALHRALQQDFRLHFPQRS